MMATPSQKSPEMTAFLEAMMKRTTRINANRCVTCGGEAKEFADALSRKEYSISGMCQKCQTEVFGPVGV